MSDEQHETPEPFASASSNPFAADFEAETNETTETARSPWAWSWLARVEFIIAGTILPAICFFFANANQPKWQSGQIHDYAKLLLCWLPASAFYPLLFYSAASMIAMVVRPERYVRYFLIRLGVYSGTVVAAGYHLLLAAAIPEDPVIFFCGSLFAAFLIWAIIGGIVKGFGTAGNSRTTIKRLLAISATTGIIVLFLFFPWLFLIASVLCATSWAVMAYGAMSWRILSRDRGGPWQFSLAQLFGLVIWLAAYCSTWRMSIKLMLIEYEKLPVNPPPNCYIATAAARGHRRLTGANLISSTSGEPFWASNQLRYLKGAELILAAALPGVHRLCRAVYNRLGPRAAACLVRPWLADAAYLTLKPAEWTARAMFALLLPGCGKIISRFYRR